MLSLRCAIYDAMASEHTSYRSTKQYLSGLPTRGKHVIQGPGENAGIIDLGCGWALALRIESHNHPSFINPYQGAATGVGGILRDIFTMGARPIALLDILRFGADQRAQELLPEVVRGISDYGNCIGVPVVGGDVYFDDTYNHNCLVNVAAFGLVQKKNIIYGHALTAGSDLIYVGSKTGLDGVGGAQMASETLDILDESAIQEADPFLEKLLLEACCELAETHWIEGMQDMGAAGLLCSTSEVVLRGRKRTGKPLGALVNLDRVPTKRDMSAVEMLLSESQERMLIVGKRACRERIINLFEHWDLEAHVIGRVTDCNDYKVIHKKQQETFSFDEIFVDHRTDWELTDWTPQESQHQTADGNALKGIWQQYDWMVGTRTLKGPNTPGHYAIIDLPEAKKELVIAWSSDEGISDHHRQAGIENAMANCVRAMNINKARPLAVTNCLNFGHPATSMGAFVETVNSLSEICGKLQIPIVSGNVSLYNAHGDHSIKPTPVLVMVGTRRRK